MRSQKMTFGLEKAPHRSLLYALGLTREEMKRPLIGVVNAANEVVPGHLHLGKIAEAVKAGIRMAGGTPMEFPAIAVCDGLAMNHEGMRFSLTSREVITDSIEIMATAHPFDALVFIPNCDKIVARYAHGHDAPEPALHHHERRPHAGGTEQHRPHQRV